MAVIRLDAVVVDAGTQVRAAVDEATVTQYAERMTEGDQFPPIVLFHDGNAYYIGDGFHRTLAAQRIQWHEIDADVRPGTKQDALWFSLGANKINGKQMTSADKKHAIVLALQTWPERSATSLAEQIGCSDRYVLDIKNQLRTTSDLPSRVTGKDGKSYPASRATKGLVPVSPNHAERLSRLDSDVPAPSRRAVPPPSNGLQFARIALMKLGEIRDDDRERQQAFDMVRRWLDARETQVAMHA